ncbi:outer membrane biosynthesis protein TonB [Streptacidiphilus sp. MAP12-33]|uniref:hypothetical protein n=1 Tax=Streptacidiphilus sp. MAP12-33 TaxID=3156266 RepID=UPI003511C5C1
MARISVGGGVSDARALPDQPGYVAPAASAEPEAAPVVEEPEPVVEAPAEPVPTPVPAPVEPPAAVPDVAPTTTSQKGASA